MQRDWLHVAGMPAGPGDADSIDIEKGADHFDLC
jgi:hypothetical protein